MMRQVDIEQHELKDWTAAEALEEWKKAGVPDSDQWELAETMTLSGRKGEVLRQVASLNGEPKFVWTSRSEFYSDETWDEIEHARSEVRDCLASQEGDSLIGRYSTNIEKQTSRSDVTGFAITLHKVRHLPASMVAQLPQIEDEPFGAERGQRLATVTAGVLVGEVWRVAKRTECGRYHDAFARWSCGETRSGHMFNFLGARRELESHMKRELANRQAA